jgi:DNA-binding response OmpR family regulator
VNQAAGATPAGKSGLHPMDGAPRTCNIPFVVATRDQTKSQRIVIVEDDEDSGLMLSYLLDLVGYQVRLARTGTAGLAMAVSWQPAIVISDLLLTGDMDGFALARALRGDPRTSSVSLIALSGLGQGQDKARGHAAGFEVYLTKPVDLETLEAAVAEVMGSRGSRSFDGGSAAPY